MNELCGEGRRRCRIEEAGRLRNEGKCRKGKEGSLVTGANISSCAHGEHAKEN